MGLHGHNILWLLYNGLLPSPAECQIPFLLWHSLDVVQNLQSLFLRSPHCFSGSWSIWTRRIQFLSQGVQFFTFLLRRLDWPHITASGNPGRRGKDVTRTFYWGLWGLWSCWLSDLLMKGSNSLWLNHLKLTSVSLSAYFEERGIALSRVDVGTWHIDEGSMSGGPHCDQLAYGPWRIGASIQRAESKLVKLLICGLIIFRAHWLGFAVRY